MDEYDQRQPVDPSDTVVNPAAVYGGNFADLTDEVNFAIAELRARTGQYENALSDLTRLRSVATTAMDGDLVKRIDETLAACVIATVNPDDILESASTEMAYSEPAAPKATKKTRAPRKAKESTAEPVQGAQIVTEQPVITPKTSKLPRAGTIAANILNAVVNSGASITAKTVASQLGLDVKQVGPILCRLAKSGHIRKAAGEGYEVAQ